MCGGTEKRCIGLNMLTRIIIFTCCAKVCSSGLCAEDSPCSVERFPPRLQNPQAQGDRFTNDPDECDTCEHVKSSTWVAGCQCQCSWGYTFRPDIDECILESGCNIIVERFGLSRAATVRHLINSALRFRNNGGSFQYVNSNWNCHVENQEYLENDGNWQDLQCLTDHTFSVSQLSGTEPGRSRMSIQLSSGQDDIAILDGLLVNLSISCSHGEAKGSSCVLFKLVGNHTYDPSLECEDEDTTSEESKLSTTPSTTEDESTHKYATSVASSTNTRSPSTLVNSSPPLSVAAATSLTILWTSKPRTDENTVLRTDMQPDSPDSLARKDRYPTAAIAGGTAAAVIIFIVAGVALFILWRRKFRPRNVGKHKNQRVTMSSLQNGHPNTTEGTVDNEIYAGDNAGIVDNVIYEGGMGADGVFSNPGYADKTPQFKPRMDAPGAFVQPNPGATNKTPTPQRNIIVEEPQYAQIVDDQYADPQKVRDRKDKKNKKKATKDENYADLKGPHEKNPGANNSNSNHIYQGLNKGTDYQSLHGPREHHQVKPSQEPKTPQDGHDYTSLMPGRSKPSAGTLPKEEADYTALEGPESPGEETAAGPDYTTLDGPDSPGDEITSGPDYTVLDGPGSPGD